MRKKLLAWLTQLIGAYESGHASQRFYLTRLITPRNLKISTTFCFFLLSFALLVIWQTPVNGSEVSIYSETPTIFWLAAILGLVNGGLLFYRGYENGSKIWILGLFQIIFCNFLIISLFALRGYFFLGRFDSLSYIGYAKDIAWYGFIPEYNFYPIVSLFLSSSAGITNLGIIDIARFTPAFFFSFYLLSIFVWSRSISRDPKFITSVMFVSMPIFYAWFVTALYHEALTVLLLPFLFYLLQKGKVGDLRFRMMTFVLITLISLMHPIVFFAVIGFLIATLVVEKFTNNAGKTVTMSITAFAFVVFFSWLSYHEMMVKNLSYVIKQMFGMVQGDTAISGAQVLASKVSFADLVQQLFLLYFDDFIFYLLAIVAGLLIIRRRRWKTHPMAVIFGCFIVATSILGVILVTDTHNIFRLLNLNFCLFLTIPIVGYFLYSLRKEGRTKIARLVGVFIIVALATSTLSLYLSPFTMSGTDIATRTEVSGVDWFINEKDAAKSVSIVQSAPSRYADMLYGHLAIERHPDIAAREVVATSHFTTFLETNQSESGNYLLLTPYDIGTYETVWQNVGRFSHADFDALSNSSNVDKIYENGELRFHMHV